MTGEKITLDHGAGGGLSHELITGVVAGTLGDVYIGQMEDSADVPVTTGRIAVTTDSFVVDPVFFGNGDIGKVAVAGTVNDLAVSGARPMYLTLAMIIEEGFPIADLVRILTSVRDTARRAGVSIVAGDTKVVHSGEADGIYLNTTGVGVFEPGTPKLGSRTLKPGDHIVVTGYLGDHSVHLLSLREGLGFEKRVLSDCAPLNHIVADVLTACGDGVHCVRDVTRGGLGTVLNELADASTVDIAIEAESLPVRHETKMAAEMLGVDVMYLANEGVLCIVTDQKSAAAALEKLRAHPETAHAAVAGTVTEGNGHVRMRDANGKTVPVDLLYGAQLPRLC